MNTKRTFSQAPTFNTEFHLKEANDKFSRLIKTLGSTNKKGTLRYNFEVDFSYAINEVHKSPSYMKSKTFDKVNAVISNLVNQLKIQKEVSEV